MKLEVQDIPMHRFLLGDLPESEATALDLEILTSDEKFEQMWEIENRLVDNYVRGRLSPADRERFQRHYLASPVHRQRVAVAGNLIDEADGSRAEAITTEPTLSMWARLSEKLGVSRPPWRFALTAAMLLLAAVSLWLFLDRLRLRNELAQFRAERNASQAQEKALADQLAATRGESEKLGSEIERLHAERNANVQQPRAREQAPHPTIISFLLSPVLVRGGGDPQILTIPARADVVGLKVKVDREDARRFQVSVRVVAGLQVWKHIDRANNDVLTAQIPANRLRTGDYILTLSAVKSPGQFEEVNRYFFRVLKQ